jgi:nucleoside-diphosphate-sugar epimerase
MVSLILKKDIKSGEVFFLGGQNYPIYEIRDVLAKVVRKKLKNITIPDKILPLIGFFSEGIGKVFKRNNLLNLDLVNELTQENWAVSTEKISNFLGFLPYTPLKEGLKQTYEWYSKFYYL